MSKKFGIPMTTEQTALLFDLCGGSRLRVMRDVGDLLENNFRYRIEILSGLRKAFPVLTWKYWCAESSGSFSRQEDIQIAGVADFAWLVLQQEIVTASVEDPQYAKFYICHLNSSRNNVYQTSRAEFGARSLTQI